MAKINQRHLFKVVYLIIALSAIFAFPSPVMAGGQMSSLRDLAGNYKGSGDGRSSSLSVTVWASRGDPSRYDVGVFFTDFTNKSWVSNLYGVSNTHVLQNITLYHW